MELNLQEQRRIDECLSEFNDDLWLRRRLELQQVIDRLDQLRANDSSANISSYLSRQISFVKFLEAECCGRQFSGTSNESKLWSELLNLMQISKKLNHRTVKFRDILRNRPQIEANEQLIRRLNESAILSQTIESTLDQLDEYLKQQCTLLISHSPESQLNEISATKSKLDDRCKAPLYTLQMELNAYLSSGREQATGSVNGKQALVWIQRMDKLDAVFNILGLFLNNFRSLEAGLLQLKPLVEVEKGLEDIPEQTGERVNQLDDSLGACKRDFAELQNFRRHLATALQKIAGPIKSTGNSELRLSRMLDSNQEIVNQDLFGSGLESALRKLEYCGRILDDAMQTLRLEFGRFYFVSDLELLEIIALDSRLVVDSGGSTQINRLLSKVFNNSINSFVVDQSIEEHKRQIIGVQSPIGERIMFIGVDPVALRKSVNLYSVDIVRILNEVQRKLRRTLQIQLTRSLQKTGSQDIDWSLPVQLMNLAESIKFCSQVEERMKDGGLNKLLEFYELRLRDLSGSEIKKHDDKFKLSAAISMTVHFISTLQSLINVIRPDDWRWLKLARFYHDATSGEVVVRIANAKFAYKFDYLPPQETSGCGAFKRLIHTEITGRCILAASQSVGLFRLGSCPFGPAGSGKTETIKALGHLLGNQVIVYNCDESNKSQSLQRLIWGLAHTGLWGCFDEFNRLSQSTLSSVAETLELLQASIREGRQMVELPDGRMTPIDQSTAFFITLNPAETGAGGKRYRGRRRLPANLRHLFLPIAMTRVQLGSIVSESLLSMSSLVTSLEAKSLGESLANLLDSMAKEAGQWFCEWDLRLAVAILRRLKLLIAEVNEKEVVMSELLAAATNLEVEPRLNAAQMQIFDRHLSRCLPYKGTDIDVNSLQLDNIKSRQLHLQLQTRVGVLLLGPTGSGKSTTWRQLYARLPDKTVAWLSLNPRACKREALFGSVSGASQKWIDGLLTARVREALNLLLQRESLQQVWLVLDGPIDPDWIESLNSVLDDNQVLTLSSGERLSFSPAPNKSIKLVIETDSVEFASPATISRLGLVNHYEQFKPSKRLTSFDDAKKQITEGTCSLLIVDTKDNESLRPPVKFLADLVDGSLEIAEYSCSKLSTSCHLLDFVMDNYDKNCFILHNTQLIARDQWKVRSFTELLQYIDTYKGFYTEQMLFRSFEGVFIITSNSTENIEQRLLSRGCTIRSDGEIDDLLPIELERLTEELDHEKSLIVTLLLDGNYSSDWRSLIADQLEGSSLFEFQNSRMALNSLEYLEKICTKRNPCKSLKRSMFIMDQLQSQLLDQALTGRLFHALNKLRSRTSSFVKFIYLTNEVDAFWRSLGPIWTLKSSKSLSNHLPSSEELRQRFTAELTDCNKQQVDWLANKVATFIASEDSFTKRHKHKARVYLNLLCKMIIGSKAELSSRSRTLKNGLSRLNEFEQQVRRIRFQREEEEAQLEVKRIEIKRLMSHIDEALRSVQGQREQVNQMASMSEAKRQEVEAQKAQLDRELEQVSQLVESSKVEVAQYLRPEALNEIKALRSPPAAVKDILEVLFLLLGIDDSSWPSIKAHLTKYSLKEELTSYDFQANLSDSLISKAIAKMDAKRDSFTLQQAQRASKAIVPILGWIQATIEYGKALIRLRPLRLRMDQLEEEAEALDATTRKLELQSTEFDAKIKQDSDKLTELKADCEKSQQVASRVKSQLARAQLARSNLDEQVTRWKQTLTSIEHPLSGLQLLSLCAIMSSLSMIDGDDDNSNDKFLNKLMDHFESKEKSRGEIVREALSLLLCEQDIEEIVFGAEDESRLLQLIEIQLMLKFGSLEMPIFINLCAKETSQRQTLIAKSLTFKSILCQQETEIVFIKCLGPTNEWIQSIEFNSRLNKLIVLEMPNDQESSLDIMDFLLTNKSNQSIASSKRILLMGELQNHEPIRHLVRPMKLLTDCDSVEDIRASIVDRAIGLIEPKLSNQVAQLKCEFQSKQKESRKAEMRLLGRLSNINLQNDGKLTLHEDLVSILSDLNQMSRSLEEDSRRLKLKMVEIRSKQSEGSYEAFAEEAAQFHLQFLSNLEQANRFYGLSLSRYMQLLFDDGQSSLSIDYSRIVAASMLPMQPEFRADFRQLIERYFEQKSRSGKGLDRSNQMAGKLEVPQLRQIFEDLFSEDLSLKPKLMVLLHDPTRSSPQLEIDQFFKQMDAMNYMKIHATSNMGFEALEATFKRLDVSVRSKGDGTKKSYCICVANAHLSAEWLNLHLIKLMDTLIVKPETKLLVLLVGECSSGSDESANFDSYLLNSAQVKYWHDDSGLELIDRFNLFQTSISSSCRELESLPSDLVKQLILFHVVCQELAKRSQGDRIERKVRWSKVYPFDFDQLSLAFKTMVQLNQKDNVKSQGTRLREDFCNNLVDFVYGSRMENSEDEKTLNRLISRFIRNQKLASNELDKILKQQSFNSDEYRKYLDTILES